MTQPQEEDLHRVLLGQVGKHHARASATPRNCLGKPFGILARIVRMQDHRITRPRKSEGNRRPDPSAGTGDQGRARRMLCSVVSHRSINPCACDLSARRSHMVNRVQRKHLKITDL
jgi:hypothetical protein